MPGMVEWALMALAGLLCLGLLTRGAVQVTSERRLGRRLDALTISEAERTPIDRSALATLLAGGNEARAEIERHLAAAGYLSRNGALAFGLVRLGATLGAGLGVYALLAMTSVPGALRLALPVAVAAGVFLLARLTLHLSSARRERRIRAELPFTLDIIVMMVESGASLDQCFRSFATSEGRAAPLTQLATRALVEDIQRGMPYADALARWADRLGVDGARELAGVLRQSIAQGTELAPTLREFAREFAERRVFVAREAIGRKTTQMTIAMLVLLMPALMIVLAGPAVSTLGSTIRQISSTK